MNFLLMNNQNKEYQKIFSNNMLTKYTACFETKKDTLCKIEDACTQLMIQNPNREIIYIFYPEKGARFLKYNGKTIDRVLFKDTHTTILIEMKASINTSGWEKQLEKFINNYYNQYIKDNGITIRKAYIVYKTRSHSQRSRKMQNSIENFKQIGFQIYIKKYEEKILFQEL